jgi:hypothetical protein
MDGNANVAEGTFDAKDVAIHDERRADKAKLASGIN